MPALSTLQMLEHCSQYMSHYDALNNVQIYDEHLLGLDTKQPPSYNRIDDLAVSKIIGQIIWLICLQTANDHINICDIKY